MIMNSPSVLNSPIPADLASYFYHILSAFLSRNLVYSIRVCNFLVQQRQQDTVVVGLRV